ncbi:MAG: glycosyltransferase [Candidatus Bathyarchaeota archaeon]|nr:glycosyltransferase [Candidatus Bathyarchaeum sp.]
MKPVVTVGMCLRNCENTLPKAINSIINQDFSHEKMQVIFVDDGSEDHTPQIVANYVTKMDIQTKVFKTKWQGLGSARNLILNNADGDYITWVDSDEILTTSYIRKQVEFLEQNPDVAITAGVFGLVSKNLVLNLELVPHIVNHANFGKPRSFIWKTEKLPGTGGTTFRVVALNHVGGFDERFTGAGEDVNVVFKIKYAGWKIRLNDAIFYELHNGMSSFSDLWKKYYWYGQGCQTLQAETKEALSVSRMSPPAGFITGFLYSLTGYRLVNKKNVFLLPIHYCFKMTAWMFGFISSQLRNN